MKIVDVGTGPPIVLIPGIQGRWEWMKPAVDALARHTRVITFSLADEPSSDGAFSLARGFDCYVDQVAEAMDVAGVRSALRADETAHRASARCRACAERAPDETIRAGDGDRRQGQNHFQPCFA